MVGTMTYEFMDIRSIKNITQKRSEVSSNNNKTTFVIISNKINVQEQKHYGVLSLYNDTIVTIDSRENQIRCIYDNIAI